MSEQLIFTKEEQKKLEIMFEGWRKDDLERKLNNFKYLNQKVIPNNIVFAGDSITEGYLFSEFFPGKIIYNRGISGITSEQLLTNINEHILNLKPQKLFILIGTNDIHCGIESSDTIKNIIKICEKTIKYDKKIIINLISIYPVNEDNKYQDMVSNRTNKVIKEINESLEKQLSNNNNIKFINLYNELLENNNLNEKYTYDGLHLSMAGYDKVTKLLSKYL